MSLVRLQAYPNKLSLVWVNSGSYTVTYPQPERVPEFACAMIPNIYPVQLVSVYDIPLIEFP